MNHRIVLSSAIASLFAASTFLWSGCGGDTTSSAVDSGGTDSTTDTGQPDNIVAETQPADTGGPDGSTDAHADAQDDGSFGGDGAIFCPTQVCPGTQKCCAIPPPAPPDAGDDSGEGGAGEGGTGDAGVGGLECLDQCPDGGPAIACEGPKGCGGSTPVCCANITIEGTLPGCFLGSASSSCVATCNQNFALACGGAMDTVVLCATSADCTDPNQPSCCELPQLPNVPFCAPSVVAMIGKCH